MLDHSSTSFMDLPSTQEDEEFAADVEDELTFQGSAEGSEAKLYYDYVEDDMDVEAF